MKEYITYGTSVIDFSLEFSERKTLGIKVHPDKSVQVIAPIGTSHEKVKEKVKSKAAWIKTQQDFFLSFHPLTPPRKYVSGETHLYLGRQYKLKLVIAEVEEVKLLGGSITVFIRDKTDTPHIRKLLKNWYKEKARIHFERLFEALLPKSRFFYEGDVSLTYRWMKKRWGSCGTDGKILLNLELIKAPKKCIEYVIIHEFCHLAYLNHSRAFYELLEKNCPDWRNTKDYLERFMV